MITNYQDFDYTYVEQIKTLPRPKGNQKGGKKPLYKDVVCAFDIETTRIEEIEQSVMYVWQFQVGLYYTVVGRTWEEFNSFLLRLCDILEAGEHLVVYVHNLSFEFQFLSGIYPFLPEEVFAVESRKILKCTMFDHFEYRCSYIHSNMGLAEFTKKMNVKHQKLSGEVFDYTKKRFWFTPLSQYEMDYATYDVIGLVEAIYTELEKDNDTLYTIPLTSTGYVRRDVKTAMRRVSREFIVRQLPSLEIYEMCREAFRGGDTHANRFFAGMLLENVNSADRSSSYPEVQCNHLYPTSEFFVVKEEIDIDELLRIINVREKAVLMRITLINMRLRNYEWGAPYLSRDKCRNIIHGRYDNGRILECQSCDVTLTDIDFKIVLSQYDFDDCIVNKVAHARYGKLPQPLIECIISYYNDKTNLKDVDGQEYYYMKSKNKLNAIYGMTAQDPVKHSIIYDHGEFKIDDTPTADLLEKYNRKAFIPYQWGVWCTAWARWELQQGIKLAHEKGAHFVYCDTDSVKYIGKINWETYNNEKKKVSKQNKAFATDPKGNKHFMGVFEMEKTCRRFKTYGAKKYAYTVEKDGKESEVIITIAGVPKKEGAKELERDGGIERFYPPYEFNAGKLESVYNDNPPIDRIIIDGKIVPITKNVLLRPTTYNLSITNEYSAILEDVETYRKMLTRMKNNGIIDVKPDVRAKQERNEKQ